MELTASCSGSFTLRETALGVRYIGGWMSLGALEKGEKTFVLVGNPTLTSTS
jgi:hypothetical protein